MKVSMHAGNIAAGEISSARRGSELSTPRSAQELLVQACFAFGLIFLFPAFTIQLAFDETTMTFTGSKALQMINLGCEVFAFALVLRSRAAISLTRQCRAILVLVAMAFIWVPFSYDPRTTVRAANVFLSTSLFGIAMVARLGKLGSLRLIIRTMVLGCALSYYWVLAYPFEAVHQEFDAFQFQHAGLWRGIFSHKQGLGVFAGLTFGLLLFYGSAVFPSSFLVRLAALAIALRCLIGTKSATGMLVAAFTPAMLYASYWFTLGSPSMRKVTVGLLPTTGSLLLGGFMFGAFDWVPEMLGKSSDMTGRTDIWPRVLENLVHTSAAFFGGGFGTGFSTTLAPDYVSVDNGYIDKIAEFGFVGAPFIFIAFLAIFFGGLRLITTTSRKEAKINVFPFSIMFVLFFINISESNLMYKHLATVLTAVAAALIASARIEHMRAARSLGRMRMNTTDPQRKVGT